jgi:16S rRNA (cytosine967-C5)-methyltransferase
MTPAARLQAAIELLDAIEASAKPADSTASYYFKGRRYIGAKDRRWVAETVWRVLRRRARIDWWLAKVGNPTCDARARVLADFSLEGGAFDKTLFEGMHSAYPPDPAERRTMEMLKGKPLFHHEMPAWVRGEYPPWIEPRLTALFGERLAEEMGAARDEAPMDLRVNTLKATREHAIAVLASEGIEATPTPLSSLGLRLAKRVALVQLKAWREGLVEVQDEGSQMVAQLVAPQPGEAVVDYCSGAGGKTLALAAAMQNKGRLVACDVAEWRMNRAADRFRRAGVHNVTKRLIEGEADKWIKRAAGSFDRVLVDAPCTGTGTWRRNPDAKWQLGETDLQELVVRQAAILASAARLVKPGGRLVYATCSLLPDENEEQIERFLASHPDFLPVDGGRLRLSPLSHRTDGFFAATLQRQASSVGEGT